MECSGVNLTSILCRSQAKHCVTQELSHYSSQVHCNLLPLITQREKWANCWGKKWKRSEDKRRKKETEGGRWFYSHIRMRVLSLKSTSTQHAHGQSCLCEDMHTRMKVHTYREAPMQGSGTRLQDQRKHRSNRSRAIAAFTVERNNRPNEQWTMLSHPSCRSCQLIKQTVWSQFQVNRGRPTPRGSGRGWRGGCCPYLSSALQRNTSSPSNSSLLAFNNVFQQQPSLHSLAPTLWESADRGGGKRQTPQ